MSSQSTDQPTLADQQAAIVAMFSLAWVAPHLPAPYITIHSITPDEVGLAAPSLEGFEQWRQALKVDPRTVDLHDSSIGTWLRVLGQFNGIKVELTTHFVLAVPDNATEASDPGERVSA